MTTLSEVELIKLNNIIAAIQESVYRYEGSLNKFLGIKSVFVGDLGWFAYICV